MRLNWWAGRGAAASWDATLAVDPALDPVTVTAVRLQGGLTVQYVGFSEPGCLALTPTGLVRQLAGAECEQNRPVLCEHQSCYTHQGQECIFPFPYKGVQYHNCTSVDVYQPWCATSLAGTTIADWGLCLPDCPATPPDPACLAPPLVPQFGSRDTVGNILQENYEADWFTLEFVNSSGQPNLTHFLVRDETFTSWREGDSIKVLSEKIVRKI